MKTFAQKSLIQNHILAHTDSSIYLLNTIHDSLGWDMQVQKTNIFNKKSNFEVKLNINKLYNGKFNPYEFKYQIHQCDNNLVLVFYSAVGNNKIAIGKIISYIGNVSEAFILDKSGELNNTILKNHYYTTTTSTGDILLTARSTFSSGFQRDKSILFDDHLNKIWEYNYPKINAQTEVNIISDVDLNKNLIYFVANYEKDVFVETSPNMDSITKVKIGFYKYDIKVRKDSIEVFVVSPNSNKTISTKVNYPFGPLPKLKGLTKNNILLYNIVDIDDEKFVFPAKKGYYMKRIDLNKNLTVLDTFIVLSDEVQKALTYSFEGQTNRVTNKYFQLIFEKTFDGNLYTIYEHGFIDLKFELLATKYNIKNNKLEWVKFIPKKTDYSNENTNAVTFSYYNNKFNITYF